MAAPLLPSPVDCIGAQSFALEPAPRIPDTNAWFLGRELRSEIEVVNLLTGRRLWVARKYIAGVSETVDYLPLLAFTRRLVVNEDRLEPSGRGVVELPRERPVRPALARRGRTGTAPVVAIRLESEPQPRWQRRAIAGCVCAIVAALLAALVTARIRF